MTELPLVLTEDWLWEGQLFLRNWAAQQQVYGADRVVLDALTDGARGDGSADARIDRLCARTGYPAGEVFEALGRLRIAGLLEHAPLVSLGPDDWGPGWRLCVPLPLYRPIPKELLLRRRREFQRSPLRRRLHQEINEGLHVCAECRCRSGALTVDHIIPLALGGLTEPGNLQVLCGPCNSSKGARLR